MASEKTIKYSLRLCKNEDIPSVMDINESTLPENYPLFFYEQILEKFPEAFTVAYLIDNPKKLIGYIMWRVERGTSSFGLDYVKKGHLVSLAVLDNYRRQGVANALLNRSMGVVKDLGVSEFVLEVRVSNSGAIRLYDSIHGYEKIKILPQYYRDGEDAYYMACRHDPSARYSRGSVGLRDEDVCNHYIRQNSPHMCFRCPECDFLLIKSLKYALPGSIDPDDPNQISCPSCKYSFLLYQISMGKFDVVNGKI